MIAESVKREARAAGVWWDPCEDVPDWTTIGRSSSRGPFIVRKWSPAPDSPARVRTLSTDARELDEVNALLWVRCHGAGIGDVLLGSRPGFSNSVIGQWKNDELAVHSDRLQADGDPIGEALALWLAGAKCEMCGGTGEVDRPELDVMILDTVSSAMARLSESTAESMRTAFVATSGMVETGVISHAEARDHIVHGYRSCDACGGHGSALAAFFRDSLRA